MLSCDKKSSIPAAVKNRLPSWKSEKLIVKASYSAMLIASRVLSDQEMSDLCGISEAAVVVPSSSAATTVLSAFVA